MPLLSNDEKYSCILAHEVRFARSLARKVIDKPVPPIWMIFIPVFFVFHAWKIKQYEHGLKDFANNYLTLRKASLSAAYESVLQGVPPDLDKLVEKNGSGLSAESRTCCLRLATMLTDHYLSLFGTKGNSLTALIQHHYQRKSNYQIYLDRLAKTEHEYNMSLMPQIEGDEDELRKVISSMKKWITELQRADIDEVFP